MPKIDTSDIATVTAVKGGREALAAYEKIMPPHIVASVNRVIEELGPLDACKYLLYLNINMAGMFNLAIEEKDELIGPNFNN